MATNPPLVMGASGLQLVPAPYLGEFIALGRQGVELRLEGLPSGAYSRRGVIFLTNMRLVFVPEGFSPEAGINAFELPLTYLSQVAFNQPIFSANNVTGKCRLVDQAGSVGFNLSFKEGGIGTFFPMAASYLDHVRRAAAAAAAAASADPLPAPSNPAMDPAPLAGPGPGSLQSAFVDPNDPSVVYLTQPVAESQRQPSAPAYVT